MVVTARTGSPAERAGLRTGDLIKSIDGRHTRPLPAVIGQRILLGAPGSTVALRILRAGTDPFDVSVVRERILPAAPEGRMLDGDHRLSARLRLRPRHRRRPAHADRGAEAGRGDPNGPRPARRRLGRPGPRHLGGRAVHGRGPGGPSGGPPRRGDDAGGRPGPGRLARPAGGSRRLGHVRSGRDRGRGPRRRGAGATGRRAHVRAGGQVASGSPARRGSRPHRGQVHVAVGRCRSTATASSLPRPWPARTPRTRRATRGAPLPDAILERALEVLSEGVEEKAAA